MWYTSNLCLSTKTVYSGRISTCASIVLTKFCIFKIINLYCWIKSIQNCMIKLCVCTLKVNNYKNRVLYSYICPPLSPDDWSYMDQQLSVNFQRKSIKHGLSVDQYFASKLNFIWRYQGGHKSGHSLRPLSYLSFVLNSYSQRVTLPVSQAHYASVVTNITTQASCDKLLHRVIWVRAILTDR